MNSDLEGEKAQPGLQTGQASGPDVDSAGQIIAVTAGNSSNRGAEKGDGPTGSAGGAGTGRRRSLSEIFSKALDIYRDNLILIVPSLIPVAAAALGMIVLIGSVGLLAVFSGDEFVAFSTVAVFFLFLIAMFALFFLAEGLTIEMIKQATSGGRSDISAAWQSSKPRMEPLILSSLLAGIIVALGYMLFVIPGLILSFAFYFVAQAVMIDGRSGVQALRASYRFVEANLADALIVIVVSLALGAVLPAIPLIGPLASLLSLPYIYALATLLYMDGAGSVQEQGRDANTSQVPVQ